MQKTRVKMILHKTTHPVSIETGAVISYLSSNGINEDIIERILALWNASLARREELYDEISKAYSTKNSLMARLPAGGRDQHFFDEIIDIARRIAALHGEIDLNEQQLWISIARESGCTEVAGGLRWVSTTAFVDAFYDPSIEIAGLEHNKRLVAKTSAFLKQLRKEHGLTLEQVAKASVSFYPMMKEAQITAPHLHRAENANTFLSPLKLMALSRVYGIPFDVFLTRLDLKEFADTLRDLARDLVIGIFGDVTSALHDKKIGMAEELVRLRRSFSTLRGQLRDVSIERESLKRQVKFLEGELKVLRDVEIKM